MKYGLPLCMALSLALFMTGCGSDATNEPEPTDEPVTAKPSEDEPKDDELDLEEDENAPEYLVSESLNDAVKVELYSELTVDGKDTVYRGATLKVPTTLIPKEVLSIEDGSSSDRNDDKLEAGEYFDDYSERVTYFKAKGAIPATRQATDHVLSATCYYDSEPVSLEKLQADYPEAIVKQVDVDGATGFVVLPDPEANDTAFVEASMYVNVGSAETPYGTEPFVVQIGYSGGVVELSTVDFAFLEAALVNMVDVDFGVDD